MLYIFLVFYAVFNYLAASLHFKLQETAQMKTLNYLLIVLLVTIDARLFEGQCRHRPVPVVFPFNYNLYLGVWYEVSKWKS